LRHAVRARGWGESIEDWQVEASGSEVDLRAVWGSGPKNSFAAGKAGTILHYDGSSWSSMNSGTNADLFALSGTGPTDVFVSGASGTVLHFDGQTWSPLS